MALIKGTNSYVDASEADAYFETRLDVAAWDDAGVSEREKALVTATTLLDSLTWTGITSDATQNLAFPRTGSYFDPKLGIVKELSGTPTRIMNGCYELAYHLLNNDGLLDNSGDVSSLKLGTALDLKQISNPDIFPGIVRSFIKPLLANAGARAWFRAN
jgi:hypothetical protein